MADDQKAGGVATADDEWEYKPPAGAAPASNDEWDYRPPASAAPAPRTYNTPKVPESTAARLWRGLTTPLPRTPGGGEESMVAQGGMTGVGSALGEAAKALSEKSEQAHERDLSKAAAGIPGARYSAFTPAAGYDLASRAARLGSGLLSPEGQATAVATAAAPEIMGPALIAHGGFGTIKAGEDIGKHGFTPENTEQLLSSGSEVVGGGAAAAHGIARPGTGRAIEALRGNPQERATQAYQKIIAPGGSPAIEQMDDAETIRRAAPYLSEQEKASPVQAKQPKGTANEGQRLGVMNYRQNALAAGEKLWNDRIVPLQDSYGAAPIDHAKVASEVRGTIDPNSPPNEAKTNAVRDLAEFYDKPTTVKEALDKIKALNGDKQVANYEKALPDKQADMLRADPALEGKVKAVNSLRDAVFDSFEQHGTPAEADYIRNARRDFGALQQVAKNLGASGVPTPGSFTEKLLNTARMVLRPKSSTGVVGDTFFNEPNKLAQKSSRLFGEAGLTSPQPPPIRTTPWAPPGPIQGPQLPVHPAFQISAAQTPGAVQQPGAGGLWASPGLWEAPPVNAAPAPLFPAPAPRAPESVAPDVKPMKPANGVPHGTIEPQVSPNEEIKVTTDSNGIRWAEGPNGYKVSVPKRIADADVADYAKPKLEEQAKLHGDIIKTMTPAKEVGAPTAEKTSGYKPSEKAETLAAPRKSLGPEFEAAEVQHEIERNKAIARNPKATAEEKQIAEQRIRDINERQAELAAAEEHEGKRQEGKARSTKELANAMETEFNKPLPGMAEHVAKQNEGAAKVKAEDLTRQANTPKNIDEAAGEMERKSPLFRGTEASPQRELLAAKQEAKPEVAATVSKPVQEEFKPEEIEEAENLIKSELGAMASGERPRRMFHENELGEYNPQRIQSAERGVTQAGQWQGVKSGRNMFPFMRDNPTLTPTELNRALRIGNSSPMYQRAIRRAIQMIRNEKMTPEQRNANFTAARENPNRPMDAIDLIEGLKNFRKAKPEP